MRRASCRAPQGAPPDHLYRLDSTGRSTPRSSPRGARRPTPAAAAPGPRGVTAARRRPAPAARRGRQRRARRAQRQPSGRARGGAGGGAGPRRRRWGGRSAGRGAACEGGVGEECKGVQGWLCLPWPRPPLVAFAAAASPPVHCRATFHAGARPRPLAKRGACQQLRARSPHAEGVHRVCARSRPRGAGDADVARRTRVWSARPAAPALPGQRLRG